MTLRSCAESACAPLCASAPTATRGWLLIEHPGPWPAFGYPRDLPAELVRAAERLLAEGVRPQLIRRTDRLGRRGDGPRAVFLVGGDARGRWIEKVHPEQLTGSRLTPRLAADAFSSRQAPRLGDPAGPLLLVCTHGQRELCCARFGRPVAVALAARLGPLVWETTHVGGDRFAANLVLLPEGAYFGRLDPVRAVEVAERALRGEADLDAYRGTAGRSAAVQSAEWHLRRALVEPSLAALRPLDPESEPEPNAAEPGPYRFARLGPDGAESRYAVRVEAAPHGYRLVEITSPA